MRGYFESVLEISRVSRRSRRSFLAIAALTVLPSISMVLAPGSRHAFAQDDPDPDPDSTPVLPMPVRLRIPILHINAPIEQVGMEDDGGMASPSGPDSVGWFAPGFRPGDPGNAVIAGHVDWVDRAAVFWFIKNLGPGDEIDVINDDGSSVAFTVDEIDAYNDDEAPMDQIFAASDTPHLNLITCGGTFNHVTHNYDHRTVVYATAMPQ